MIDDHDRHEWVNVSSGTGSSERWSCGICGRGIGSNSIHCTNCKGNTSIVMKSFICRICLNPVTSTGRTGVHIGASANLELVDKFCYLGDVMSLCEDADAAMEARV